MKLLFLGVSSALTVGRNKFQSNMLLESSSGRKMLIDCGSDIRHSLFEQGYGHSDVDAVYISHMHADHTGGLEWLGFSKHFLDHNKPLLYISADQKRTLWEHVLSGGMSSLENERAELSTFFEVKAVKDSHFTWENIPMELIKMYHAMNNSTWLPSYGLLIRCKDKKILITTDTRMKGGSLNSAYEQADVIFQDCETAKHHSAQHAHYNELNTLSPSIKKKMWLYDYNCGPLPNAQKDGFQGFVKQGQAFHF